VQTRRQRISYTGSSTPKPLSVSSEVAPASLVMCRCSTLLRAASPPQRTHSCHHSSDWRNGTKSLVAKVSSKQVCRPTMQTARDGLASANQVIRMLSSTSSVTDMARLIAALSSHTGDCRLHAPPIASAGLRFSVKVV